MTFRRSKTRSAANQRREPRTLRLSTLTAEFHQQHGAGSLHEAVRQKKGEIVQELCRAGIDLNTIWNGKTALAEAIERDELELVAELLAAKASPCARAENGPSGLHVACEKGQQAMIEKLLAAGGTQGIDDLYKDENGDEWSALMRSSLKGDLETVETLIEGKADVNKCDQNGFCAASRAVMSGSAVVLESLLKNGADAMHRLKNGMSLVYGAAANGRIDCLDLLIQANACVLTSNEDGSSPLMTAAARGHIDALRLLLAAKADATSSDIEGYTSLHFAATYGHNEAIKILVIEGQAKLDVRNDDGDTPLRMAKPGSSTHELLTEMELVGADEHVLVKSAARRFRPLVY